MSPKLGSFLLRACREGARWLASTAVLALVACGSATTSPGGTDSGTSADGAAAPAVDGSTGCSTLSNSAPEIATGCDPSAGPAPAGGAISDGTYYLTDSVAFNGGSSGTCPSPPLVSKTSKTIRITGATFESVEPNSMGVAHYQGSWVTSGTTITFTTICETPQAVHLATFSKPYTATPSQLVLFGRGSTSNIETYTKQ